MHWFIQCLIQIITIMWFRISYFLKYEILKKFLKKFLKYEILNHISSLLSRVLIQLKEASPQKFEISYFALFCTVFFYLITLVFFFLITCHCWAAQLARFLSSAACCSLNSPPLIRKQEIITLPQHKTLRLQAAATLDHVACMTHHRSRVMHHVYKSPEKTQEQEWTCVCMCACLCL